MSTVARSGVCGYGSLFWKRLWVTSVTALRGRNLDSSNQVEIRRQVVRTGGQWNSGPTFRMRSLVVSRIGRSNKRVR